ncbi:MAG: Stp1/IreP family PP2C-type Ser/Thr phosphatase [Ruminococcus sp.]|uniref:Stp1/IreP family PP2C-type Ser/Thr phosphatase n=1 Tax=uncultured Ruminococcus sp. TaxID=165186 RepID=UPI0015657903|nr:Stp1/IreP family PP2C-type Ser/Thr phosphatase [uncultured Ruminococcus sp.]MCR4862615.1 Stp1/IreP family PP2C-type Ser/Thr phosphatase [Ruminococcus sp.]
MRFRFGTDIGLKREENQDAVKCEYYGHNVLAVVCDGMGGERAGKEASELAIQEFFQRFSAGYSESLGDEDIRKLLISSVSAANSVIYTKARLDFKNFGMGTTCVAAFVNKDSVFIANVGDSRAYLIGDKGLRRITDDHNVASMLYEQGKITEEELENHPQKHMLVRAVGVEKTVLTDTFMISYTDKIGLLLCSDGLSGYCSDDEIYDVILNSSFDDVAEELINLALSKGGRDNVTVAVISD